MLKKVSFKNTSGFTLIRTRLRRNLVNVQAFTLIELLIVIVILGVLATVALVNFKSSQVKSRDVERKSNTKQIATALEAYYSDHGAYPLSGTGGDLGKIVGCTCGVTPVACQWGTDPREFCDQSSTVYMQVVPSDPTETPPFCYLTDASGSYFKLYGKLENANDPEISGSYICNSTTYNFGISSGNTAL